MRPAARVVSCSRLLPRACSGPGLGPARRPPVRRLRRPQARSPVLTPGSRHRTAVPGLGPSDDGRRPHRAAGPAALACGRGWGE
jgi:hypothetical protein